MPLNWPTLKEASNGTAGVLYVVSTPIGNLADITLRALDVLGRVDLIAAEDTRHTRGLLSAHQIRNRLIAYHEHNAHQRTPELLDRLTTGTTIALVTNAGTPSVSDPGYRLAHAALARQIRVIPIPGVSAAVTALSVCGLPTDAFTFVGFPPRKKSARTAQLQQLAGLAHTLIFYQSPRRLVAFINEILAVLGDRPAVLAREMTKIYEEFVRGRLSEIAARLQERTAIKGECTLLVGGAASEAFPKEHEDLQAAIAAALSRQKWPLTEIAKRLARQFGLPRQQVYEVALRLQRNVKQCIQRPKSTL